MLLLIAELYRIPVHELTDSKRKMHGRVKRSWIWLGSSRKRLRGSWMGKIVGMKKMMSLRTSSTLFPHCHCTCLLNRVQESLIRKCQGRRLIYRAQRARDSRPDMSDDEDLEDRDDEADMSGGEEYAELAIDPEDHATLDALNRGGGEGADEGNAGGRTLADLIFSKMEGGAVSRGAEDEDEGEFY